MGRYRVGSAVVVCLVLLAGSRAMAQEGTSQVRGHVTDQQGGVLPGVTVTVTNQDSGNVSRGGQQC